MSIFIEYIHILRLLCNNKVLIFDCTSFGPFFLPLHCTLFSSSFDCTAYSLFLDPTILSLSPSPLQLLSDTFYSSTSPLPDGFSFNNHLLHTCPPSPPLPSATGSTSPTTSSFATGTPLTNPSPTATSSSSMAATNSPTNSSQKDDEGSSVHTFDFLRETTAAAAENNLSPFLHLLLDGNLGVMDGRWLEGQNRWR
ncbi:hypothetical protein QJS04_geneDACA016820 [Acorus gramineus]|uniref:Uncharacterized protein n=1 Tax=Acorus gramineus TaxID=55184 RepID=A0AAV9AQD8_ACOGR|nr:hypothetical protein QJS04_geneDACA016820 [Acorus gramineus]